MQMRHDQVIPILDFGAQYAQLIARRVREQGVYSELVRPDISPQQLKAMNARGLILSGGPSSVYEPNAPKCDPKIFDLDLPILGICYGMQLGAQILGGQVKPAKAREFGRAKLHVTSNDPLVHGLPQDTTVWMSHGDQVMELPPQFEAIAQTTTCPFAAMKHKTRPFYGVQFHPEVTHTPRGEQIFHNFIYEICKCDGTWTMENFIDQTVRRVREQVGTGKVICGLSGGVDSSVVAALLHKAIGDQLTCIFVNNGLLRAREEEVVQRVFGENFHIKLKYVDASERFLTKLRGVVDPEEKRKIIGNEFIKVFEDAIVDLAKADQPSPKTNHQFKFLAQGTLYPDVIESVAIGGNPAHVIKSHHNVGGLPEKMHFELVEPLRQLFKDEVRQAGLQLGLPKEIVYRQPFPAPGLAGRILGGVTPDRLRR